jgi:hypothetical protein
MLVLSTLMYDNAMSYLVIKNLFNCQETADGTLPISIIHLLVMKMGYFNATWSLREALRWIDTFLQLQQHG